MHAIHFRPHQGQTDLFATCNALGGANGLTVRQDLSVLAPDEIATLGTMSVNIFNAQIANVVQRLGAGRRRRHRPGKL